jgi:drug/metabolite transporter (DMT)-like permease
VGAENLRGIGLMILAMALFAIEDMFLKFAAVDLPTGQIVFLSGALGMPVFFILARRAGARVMSRGFLHPTVLARNFGEMVGTLGYITALALVPLATVSAVLQALPLGVTMAAALFLGEPVGWRRWSAIAVGFLGVLLVIQPGTAGFRPEALWVLLTVAGLTLRDLATRAIPAGSSTAQVSAWGLGSVALLGLFMMIWQGDWSMPTSAQSLPLVGALLFGTVGYAAIIAATRHGDVSVVSPFRYTRLIFAVIIAALFFHELPNSLTWWGAALIIGSGLYSFARERRRKAALPMAP